VIIAKDYCSQQGLDLKFVFEDVASGLNTRRRGLNKLLKLIIRGRVDRVVISYKDRLTRFGYEYLSAFFLNYGCQLELVHDNGKPQSLQEELVEDLIAIVPSFSGRVHGLRSAKSRRSKKSKPIVNS